MNHSSSTSCVLLRPEGGTRESIRHISGRAERKWLVRTVRCLSWACLRGSGNCLESVSWSLRPTSTNVRGSLVVHCPQPANRPSHSYHCSQSHIRPSLSLCSSDPQYIPLLRACCHIALTASLSSCFSLVQRCFSPVWFCS